MTDEMTKRLYQDLLDIIAQQEIVRYCPPGLSSGYKVRKFNFPDADPYWIVYRSGKALACLLDFEANPTRHHELADALNEMFADIIRVKGGGQ